jgi:hypothetical protein
MIIRLKDRSMVPPLPVYQFVVAMLQRGTIHQNSLRLELGSVPAKAKRVSCSSARFNTIDAEYLNLYAGNSLKLTNEDDKWPLPQKELRIGKSFVSSISEEAERVISAHVATGESRTSVSSERRILRLKGTCVECCK